MCAGYHIVIFPQVKIVMWPTCSTLDFLVWANAQSELLKTSSSKCSQDNGPNSMGSALSGLIFGGISAPFKQHNVINGNELERQRIPQRQQEIVVMVSSAGSLDLKSIYASDKEEFQIEKCNFGILCPSDIHCLPRAAWTLRQSCSKSSVCFVKDSLLETPVLWTCSPRHDWTYSSEHWLHNTLPHINLKRCAENPLRWHYWQLNYRLWPQCPIPLCVLRSCQLSGLLCRAEQ